MSDMLARYLASTKLRPAAARQIPNLATNVVDITNEFSQNFATQIKRGDPTRWTNKALNWYDQEVATIFVPDGFQPSEPGQGYILNRWNSVKKYAEPGRPST